MERIRILIADDHPLFRSGIRGLLESVPGMQVVGEAGTVEETVRLTTQLRPDVILMDIRMPGAGSAGANGIEATRQVLATQPGTGVLIVTMFEDDGLVFAAMRASARGSLLKDAGQDEALRAIRTVAHGEAIFSSSVAWRGA